jgi:hypothetical protein
MGYSTSIACYPAKIPHFLESLKILAFYAILPSTPLIACESFIQALLSGFERFVCRLARPSNRWLKRPTPNASRRCPPFKSSTACRALAPAASFRGPLCFASLSAKKYGTPYFSARNRTSKYSRSCSFVAELLSLRKAGALRFIRVIRRGASAAVGWQGFDCRRVAAAFWFS